SRPWAPWYAIPADNKAYMRVMVAKTIVKTLQNLAPAYPSVDEKRRAELIELRKQLDN
ncbi:MAG: hypothetical protein ACI9DC_003129, partial [Gammaproteobacteria bacterium]